MKAINYTAKVLPDAIIAATADEYELILATANEKHFVNNISKKIKGRRSRILK